MRTTNHQKQTNHERLHIFVRLNGLLCTNTQGGLNQPFAERGPSATQARKLNGGQFGECSHAMRI